MIVETFLVFIGIAIFCIVYGEMTKELSWTIVGCSIFFILVAWVVFGKYVSVPGHDANGLQFKSGVLVNQTSSTTTELTYKYSSYDDGTTFWIGFFLSLIGGLGIILTGISRRGS